MAGVFAIDGAELMDRQIEVEDEVQCLRDQVLGLQGELRLAVCKMTTVCSLIKFDAPESRANPVHLSGEKDAVSLWSLSTQLVALQDNLSQATEFHKQSAHSAWARADQMFEKANDKVDSFHKYCAGLITMSEMRNEQAHTSCLPKKVEVPAESVQPLPATQALQEHDKVLGNLKMLEKEIEDAYAQDQKKLQHLVDGLHCEEGHERNQNGVQDCHKPVEARTVDEPHPEREPEIVGMNVNDGAKGEKANNVLRRDSQQRSARGAQLVGSELKKMQQELSARFQANGLSRQVSAFSSKSNSKSVSWDCSEASDCPAGEMERDIPQVTVERQTSSVPPLRLSGLRDVPGDAGRTPRQSARPVRLSAREQGFANCNSPSSSRTSLSTTCSSPRVELMRFLSSDAAGGTKPMSSATKEDSKPFQVCQGGSVRTNSARVNQQPFASQMATPVQSLRPLSCR